MGTKQGRQERALERLKKRLAPTLTIPLSAEQKRIWTQIISLKRKLNLLTDTDLAVERVIEKSH